MTAPNLSPAPTALAPANVAELVDAVISTPRLIPVGSRTKERLSAVDAAPLSMKALCGIVEYDPSEYTFTALAGTLLSEVVGALAERGQHLPFDPMLVDAGGTLGGAVASGLSGPGRFRFGGLRDFILGVRFVDGSGRLLRLGGKVVKNAAGFDVPKFLVGSLGRFGVLAEMTFKVFPKPPSSRTIQLFAANYREAADILAALANTRWDLEALDIIPNGTAVYARVGAPAGAADDIVQDILNSWPGELLAEVKATALWKSLREFDWIHPQGCLVKIPASFRDLAGIAQAASPSPGARLHASSGGNVIYVSLPAPADAAPFGRVLEEKRLTGLVLRGKAPMWLGVRRRFEIEKRVKEAMDPLGRFSSLDDYLVS